MTNPTIILASNSPRRRELLDQAGIGYIADPADADESRLPDEKPEEFAVRVALDKARLTAGRHREGLVIGADTIVVVEGEILGKPSSAADAAYMLSRISGRTHRVITGVAVIDAGTGRCEAGFEVTEVQMRAIDKAESDAYIATGEPMDKAGAYGIQGKAAFFVEGIDGCYPNVVGLPLSRLGRMLESFGFSIFN